MPPSVRTGSRIDGEFLAAVWRKDRGVDVGIRVVPEADAITPECVVIDIVNGERPIKRPDPAISAVAVPPPPGRGATAMPTRQRVRSCDLPAHRRVAGPGIHDVASVLRSQGSHSDLPVTRDGTRATQSPQSQDAGDRESRNPKRADAKTHPCKRRTRQQGCQNDNGNSNAGLRHGTLAKPGRVTSDDAESNRKFPALTL